MAFKLYTETKFRVYKNHGGRFVPQFNNYSDRWESFKELGTTATRARRKDAEKFIQRKADRLFYGQASIEYVEAALPEQKEESSGASVRDFADITPEEKIAFLTRLIENPYFPDEDRQKLLIQRSELETSIC